MVAAREVEVGLCALVRTEVAGMQHELDRETERVAISLRKHREEEDEQIKAEVR